MNIDLLGGNITPAEGEKSVRTYHCTYYHSRILGLKAVGYLSVTDKRVIFQALGSSSAGKSVIQSEVPIADVSGITSYKGTYFSFGHLLGALVAAGAAYFLATTLFGLLGTFGDISYDTLKGITWITSIIAAATSFFIPNKMIWRTVLAAAAAGILSVIAAGSLMDSALGSLLGMDRGSSGIEMIVMAALAIYTLVCIGYYARRPTFSLSVGSKGGASTPINISGATGLGIFDVAAGKALSAEPGDEAEILLKELGAVVMDIQMLGEFGINKWKIGS